MRIFADADVRPITNYLALADHTIHEVVLPHQKSLENEKCYTKACTNVPETAGRLVKNSGFSHPKNITYPNDGRKDILYIAAMIPVHRDYERRRREGRLDSGATTDDTHLDYEHVCLGNVSATGLQTVEMFLHTLDSINKDDTLLPGATLGGIVLDSCNSPRLAADSAMDIIKGVIAAENVHPGFDFTCSDKKPPEYKKKNYDKVIGLVGGQSSEVSIELANVFKWFSVPQVSYLSTAGTLSNTERYP